MKMNYSVIYVMLAAIVMLMVHVIAPSAILAMILVILLPLVITIGCFDFFEVHEKKSAWTRTELEEYEADPDYDYYISLVK